MKKFLIVAALAFAGYTVATGHHHALPSLAPSAIAEQSVGRSGDGVAEAFTRHESNLQVSGEGVVIRLLPDDSNGTRHQRFILRLPSNRTVLIAHNIDLAPRVDGLRVGDAVRFYGEYEWNPKGGVVHWTHRDPRGSHAAGWLEHRGRRYQ